MALVGTYSGTVPCGDCEGIYTSLTLQPDQKYLLIEEYIRERPYPQESEGRWTTREGGEQVMLLKDEGEEVRYFEVIDGKTLRVVLPQEERIENSLDYMLARVDSTDIEMAE
nr:copper resistance protein NlpE [Rufibacter quisquiliarum]